MKKNNTGFPERLKKLRLEKGLSQTDIAKKLDVHPNHIGRYERGESNPNTKFLKALADSLEVSTDYLYDGIEEDAAVADFNDRDLLELFKKIEKFPAKEKEMVKVFLTALSKNLNIKAELAS